MREKMLLFLVLILFIMPIFAKAVQVPLPFKLNIQKNATLHWTTHIFLEEPMEFNYIEGGGYCDDIETGTGAMLVNFYNKTVLVKTISGVFSLYGKWDGFYRQLDGVQADTVEYVDWIACPGLVIGNMGGKLEAIQNIREVQEINKVVINDIPVEIGTLPQLIPTITLRDPANDARIIDENIKINSSNPNVLVWFGEDPENKPSTTKNLNDLIYACSDVDNNKICDSKDAEIALCRLSEGDEWYKGWCCSLQGVNTAGCEYRASLNAYCGKTQDNNVQLAIPEATGQIYDLSGCTQKTQVVFDETKKMHDCKNPSDWDSSGFFNIKRHQYFCDSNKLEIKECGAETPFSTINQLFTGQNTTINSKINYCIETGIFSTNLDYSTNTSCKKSGQSWTGTRCCSEFDDRKETAGANEYYSDASNETNTKTPGGCWNSTYIRAGTNPPNYFNNSQTDKSIINYNGTFLACKISNPAILGLQNTDPHYNPFVFQQQGIPPPPSPITQQQTTNFGQLLTNTNACGTVLQNAKWEQAILSHAICEPWGEWVFTADFNDTLEKINPFGINKTTMPLAFKCDSEFKETGCCPITKCWNGKSCSANGEFFDSDKSGFICDAGNWKTKTKKINYDKTDLGFCTQEEQCLVSSQGNSNPDFENHPEKFFAATSNNQKPRCITDKQYLKDEYCENGNWTTRTKLIATQLMFFAQSLQDKNYDLFCDSYNNALNDVKYSYGQGQSLVENFIKENCVKEGKLVPCVNNFCVLKTAQGVVAIGTSLNTPINGQSSFLRALNLDKSACDNTLSAAGFEKCAQAPTFGGQVWHHPKIESVIYLPPQLLTNIQDTFTQQQLRTILNYVNTKNNLNNPMLNFEFFDSTKMYGKLLNSKKDSRTIFAFLEKQPLTTNKYYFAAKYSNFSIGTDPCLALFKGALKEQNPICEAQVAQTDFIVIAKDIQENTQLNQFAKWKDLTSKLRLVLGPSRIISTDLGGQTINSVSQTETQECPT